MLIGFPANFLPTRKAIGAKIRVATILPPLFFKLCRIAPPRVSIPALDRFRPWFGWNNSAKEISQELSVAMVLDLLPIHPSVRNGTSRVPNMPCVTAEPTTTASAKFRTLIIGFGLRRRVVLRPLFLVAIPGWNRSRTYQDFTRSDCFQNAGNTRDDYFHNAVGRLRDRGKNWILRLLVKPRCFN